MATLTDRPRQRGNPARRTLLMDAALRVLDQKNIMDATVDDIVHEASVARGTFYIYFRDKYDILMALADRLNDELFSDAHLRIDRRAPAYDRLRASLRSVIRTWQVHASLFRSLSQMALARPDFFAHDQHNRMIYINRMRADLESSIDRGHARPIDAAVAAKALAAMMDWFCLLWMGLGEGPYDGASDPDQIERITDNLALLWYRAIYAEDPPIP